MQLTRNEIFEKLKEILVSADPRCAELAEKCDENTNLTTEFGLTSVNMLYMVIAIEEVFGFQFDDVNIGDFVTMGDVVNYVEEMTR